MSEKFCKPARESAEFTASDNLGIVIFSGNTPHSYHSRRGGGGWGQLASDWAQTVGWEARTPLETASVRIWASENSSEVCRLMRTVRQCLSSLCSHASWRETGLGVGMASSRRTNSRRRCLPGDWADADGNRWSGMGFAKFSVATNAGVFSSSCIWLFRGQEKR